MNLLTAFVATLLIILTLTFAGLLISAIVFNVKAGKKYRRSLAAKIDQLRLGRMLGALGIDINTYLHAERIVEIKQQMDRCSACENTDLCDDRLAEGNVSADEIDFCNNEDALQKIAGDRHETN